MENPTARVVAFTGHRSYDGGADAALDELLRTLFREGCATFLTGMAEGFDLSAGEAVVRLKEEFPGVRLCCVVPHEGQARGFSAENRERYERLLSAADEVIVLQSHYTPGSFQRRNDYLVEHAERVVAWYDGSKQGGTCYTVRRARRLGRKLENLYPQLQQELFTNDKTKTTMLKHIVMWRFKEGAEGKSRREHALWMKEHLEALVGVIPQIQSLEMGVNEFPSEAAYDAVLTVCFLTKEDLDTYKVHPAHVAVSEHCEGVRECRVVVDYFV